MQTFFLSYILMLFNLALLGKHIKNFLVWNVSLWNAVTSELRMVR